MADVAEPPNGAPGRNRTGDLALRRHSLYPLSYRGLRTGRRSPGSGLGVGGGEGDRTLDLRIANATLSQLSYSPQKWPGILAAKVPEAKVWFNTGSKLR
jgi:hypothetical protein